MLHASTAVLAASTLAIRCQAECASAAVASACDGREEGASLQAAALFSLPPSLVKCIGATLAGSLFAVVGMIIEGRKDQQKPQFSREDLVLKPRSQPSTPKASPATPQVLQMSSERCTRATSSSSRRDQPQKTHKAAAAKEPSKDQLFKGLKPSSPFSGRKELSEVEKATRQVKSILNKLTRDKFDTLYAQLLDHCKVEDTTVRAEVIQVLASEVFKKATTQHSFIDLYADVCAKMDADLKQEGVEVNFRRVLLEQCQESFTLHLEPPKIDEGLEYEEQFEELVKYKTKMLGNVKLIGHLLRLRMLAAKIIFHCTDELISIGTSEALETLCAFLETLGATFDRPDWSGHARLREVFLQVELISTDSRQSNRTKCLLKDLLDKRKNQWKTPQAPADPEIIQKKKSCPAEVEKKLDWAEARMRTASAPALKGVKA